MSSIVDSAVHIGATATGYYSLWINHGKTRMMTQLVCLTYDRWDCLGIDWDRLVATVESTGGRIRANQEQAWIWIPYYELGFFSTVYPHLRRMPQEDSDSDCELDWD